MEQQSDESDTTESSTANASNNEEINEDAADITQTEEEDLGKVGQGARLFKLHVLFHSKVFMIAVARKVPLSCQNCITL